MHPSIAPAIDNDQIASHNRNFGYAGDMGAKDAWELLKKDPKVLLVDVRTPQEWEQVGFPELSALQKQPLLLTWKKNEMNPGELFTEDFSRLYNKKNIPVLLLCKGGGRSKSAAMALTKAGYNCCINILGGFEGQNGWMPSGLPVQKKK